MNSDHACAESGLWEAQLAGERILVIDDSKAIRSILRDMILGPQGYQVITAQDGQQGIDHALKEHPDLILTDVSMPRMDGIEVLRRLRDAHYEWPVILMTFHGSEEIAVQAFRLGVRDYIRKPFTVEEVLTCVERALVESRLRREREALMRRLEIANYQLNRQVAELTALYAIGQAVTAVLDLDKLLNRIVEASVYLCHAETGALYLVDQESDSLYLKASLDAGTKSAHSARLKVEKGLVIDAVRTGKPALLTSETPSARLQVREQYAAYALVNVPLVVKREVIGVLSVANCDRQRDFYEADVTRLSGLANYAAIAIENARLYEATRKVVAAEVLNHTVVTISHYINNPLMALMMNIDELAHDCQDGGSGDIGEQVGKAARFTKMKIEEISSVISILRDIASPQFVTYMDDIKMIDIEHKVSERLHYLRSKYQA
jgi:two-component system NtrC family sensor kinase